MRFRTAVTRAIIFACMVVASASCKSCKSCKALEDDESEEEEERDKERIHFWRVEIRIVGNGRVKTFIDAFDCVSDGKEQSGVCGPKLVTFKELKPATLEATAAPGYALDHWESVTREPDGALTPRKGPMPDGRVYLNGFGYADTGQLETVTAVFVPMPNAGIRD